MPAHSRLLDPLPRHRKQPANVFELAHLLLILKKKRTQGELPTPTRHPRLCAFALSHAWLVGRVIGSAGTLPPSRSLTAEGAEKEAGCVCGGTQSDTRLPVRVRRKCGVTTAFFVPVSCFFVVVFFGLGPGTTIELALCCTCSPELRPLTTLCCMIHAFHLTVLSTLLFVRLHRQQLQQRGFCFSLDHNCAVLPLCSNDRKLPRGNICLLGKF